MTEALFVSYDLKLRNAEKNVKLSQELRGFVPLLKPYACLKYNEFEPSAKLHATIL